MLPIAAPGRHESNSHGSVRGWAVFCIAPVPDSSPAGADRITYKRISVTQCSARLADRKTHVVSRVDERIELRPDLRDSPAVVVREEHPQSNGEVDAKEYDGEDSWHDCRGRETMATRINQP